jgi:hypothetical protein
MPKARTPEHKVIISGTGRSGTTFLVRLLGELGLDTGINKRNWGRKYFEHCNAGLEHDILDARTPYILKNPALCDTLEHALGTGRFVIDHAYIPIRELGAVAASRAHVGGSDGSVPGGLWGTSDPAGQRAVMAEMFHRLVHTLASHEIPHTFILFPRMVLDPDYTQRQLEFLVAAVSPADFRAAFGRVAQPSLVHEFGPGAPRIERREPAPSRPRGLRRLLADWK